MKTNQPTHCLTADIIKSNEPITENAPTDTLFYKINQNVV